MEENTSDNLKTKNRSFLFEYPSQDELELIILKISPCSITDILRHKKIEVNSGTIETLQKRVVMLENDGKVIIRRFNRLWIIYPKFFEEVREKEIKKKLSTLLGE